jgi:transcription antitermination factor NusG
VCDEHFQVGYVVRQLDGSFDCGSAVVIEEVQLETGHVDLFVFRDGRGIEVLFLADFIQFVEI